MSEETVPVPSPEPVDAPVLAGPTPSHHDHGHGKQPTPEERYRACNDEILAALRRHGCRLVAKQLDPVPVGVAPTDTLQLRAVCMLIPE